MPSSSVFEVLPENGFLPKKPALRKLPAEFAALENVMQRMPFILRDPENKTELKELVHQLPIYDVSGITDETLLQALFRDYGFLTAAYVLEGKEKGSSVAAVVPRQLSLPFYALSKILDEELIMSYDSYCLNNHYSVDGSNHWSKLRLIRSFVQTPEEATFILIHAEIESHTPKLIESFNIVLKALENDDVAGVRQGLTLLKETQERMIVSGIKMFNASESHGYLTRVRPWIFGYKNNPDFPNGVVFEGCFDDQPQLLRGETGAQSNIVPTLDAFLGITHKEDVLFLMLKELEAYRPAPHREYLRFMRSHTLGTSENGEQFHRLRAFVEKDMDLVRLLNACVLNVFNFRSMHVVYSDVYVARHTNREAATGGTPFKVYLRKHRDESFRQQITKFPEAILEHNEISDRDEFQRDLDALDDSENGVPAFMQVQFKDMMDKYGNGDISLLKKSYPEQAEWDRLMAIEHEAINA